MRVGVIYTAFNTADLVPASLEPWITARREKLGGHVFKIAAVCVPFTGFPQDGAPDNTRALLEARGVAGDIDYLLASDTPMTETEARGTALYWLVDRQVDTIIQWDSDEVPTLAQLERILAFWSGRPHVAWARLSYRNAVFTKRQFLAQPFQPPRIHRVHLRHCIAHSFWDDNNVAYREPVTGQMYRDVEMPHVTVPPAVALVDHWSWLNDGPGGRSHRKVKYQESRGWQCSFAWDDSRGGLIFRDGLPAPEVITEDAP